MKINGEAIYATRPCRQFGEGLTAVPANLHENWISRSESRVAQWQTMRAYIFVEDYTRQMNEKK